MLPAIVTIEPSFITGAMAYVSDVFNSASLLIILVIGLPLGFWVARRVIGLVRAR